MKKSVLAFAAAVLVAVTALSGSPAFAYTKKVREACSADYASLCSRYKQGSAELRRCFESNRRILSETCVTALVNAGEVPARYLKR